MYMETPSIVLHINACLVHISYRRHCPSPRDLSEILENKKYYTRKARVRLNPPIPCAYYLKLVWDLCVFFVSSIFPARIYELPRFRVSDPFRMGCMAGTPLKLCVHASLSIARKTVHGVFTPSSPRVGPCVRTLAEAAQ